MQEKLKQLEKLQLIDFVLQETEDALAALPATLQNLKTNVDRVEKLLEGERQQFSEINAYKMQLEITVKSEQEQLNKSKGKLSQIRTSKEYMASQRELETSRKSLSEREDELLKLMSAIDAFQSSIQVHENELNALKLHFENEEKETTRQIAQLESKRKEQRAERDKMASQISKEILSRYDSIRHRRENAVVPAINGVCSGCHMHIPPQLYNILFGGKSIELCPSCQRIIYLPQG